MALGLLSIQEKRIHFSRVIMCYEEHKVKELCVPLLCVDYDWEGWKQVYMDS